MQYDIFDAHCDTLTKLCDCGGSLEKNSYQVDLQRLLKRENGSIQVFAAFVDKKNDILTPKNRAINLINTYYNEIEKHKEKIHHCENSEDVFFALRNKKIAGILSLEGGEALEGNIDNLDFFYSRGVRGITLCWNYKNEIAEGVMEDTGSGLTEFGKAVIKKMNELGMIVDVSHISEKSFWDVLEESKGSVAVTHSNSKAIHNHKRNLSDEQIEAIIKCRGCIGINLYSEFLSDKVCGIKDVISHVEHIFSLGGENNVGFGSDFDGMDSLPKNIYGVENVYMIIDEMLRLGYSDEKIKKVASGNFLRLFKEVVG